MSFFDWLTGRDKKKTSDPAPISAEDLSQMYGFGDLPEDPVQLKKTNPYASLGTDLVGGLMWNRDLQDQFYKGVNRSQGIIDKNQEIDLKNAQIRQQQEDRLSNIERQQMQDQMAQTKFVDYVEDRDRKLMLEDEQKKRTDAVNYAVANIDEFKTPDGNINYAKISERYNDPYISNAVFNEFQLRELNKSKIDSAKAKLKASVSGKTGLKNVVLNNYITSLSSSKSVSSMKKNLSDLGVSFTKKGDIQATDDSFYSKLSDSQKVKFKSAITSQENKINKAVFDLANSVKTMVQKDFKSKNKNGFNYSFSKDGLPEFAQLHFLKEVQNLGYASGIDEASSYLTKYFPIGKDDNSKPSDSVLALNSMSEMLANGSGEPNTLNSPFALSLINSSKDLKSLASASGSASAIKLTSGLKKAFDEKLLPEYNKALNDFVLKYNVEPDKFLNTKSLPNKDAVLESIVKQRKLRNSNELVRLEDVENEAKSLVELSDFVKNFKKDVDTYVVRHVPDVSIEDIFSNSKKALDTSTSSSLSKHADIASGSVSPSSVSSTSVNVSTPDFSNITLSPSSALFLQETFSGFKSNDKVVRAKSMTDLKSFIKANPSLANYVKMKLKEVKPDLPDATPNDPLRGWGKSTSSKPTSSEDYKRRYNVFK